MKYQIVISERCESKRYPTALAVLKTHLPIGDVSYWQRRISKLSDDLRLNEISTAKVAK